MAASPESRPLRALLLDVDGTLYHARRLRVRVAGALLGAMLRQPHRARTTVRRISAYRRALEEIRYHPRDGTPVGDLHLARAAELAATDAASLRPVVERWMLECPLRYLRGARRDGVVEFCEEVQGHGLRLGFFSDYPVGRKLEALGLAAFGDLRLCGTDPAINALKPWPNGFRLACQMWRLDPAEVLYIGDRPEVDAIGAAAAGMRCAIIDPRYRRRSGRFADYVRAPGFPELGALLRPWLDGA